MLLDRYLLQNYKFTDQALHVDVRGGGSTITPSNYTGNITVNSVTGQVLDTMASGAAKLRLLVESVTGTPKKLYGSFGINSGDALASVDATPGSELGMLLVAHITTITIGTQIILSVPLYARGGGVFAVAVDTGSIVLNVVQGV